MSRTIRRAAGRIAVAVVASVIVAGCAASEAPASLPPATTTAAGPTTGPAAALTRTALASALGTHGLALTDPQVPFRPPEGQQLTAAPRAVYQVALPADPDGGFIVVYELPDGDRANQAANEQAAYLASGPGRVQSSLSTIHVIRVVGTTVVLYSWDPGAAPDPLTPEIQAALETVGMGVTVPS